MAPLIAGLISGGLDLLANAALAKGKEYLEEKSGIMLDAEKPLSSEDLLKLKVVQEENKIELERLKLEDNKLQAYVQEMFLKDVGNARDREVRITTAADAPYLNKIITPILALIITVGGGIILQINPDAEVKYAVVSIMMLVLGYYFGTSQGSTKAQQMMRDMARKNGHGS